MPTRQVEPDQNHADTNQPIHEREQRDVESPSSDRMQGASGDMHATPDPSTAGPRESTPDDKVTSTTTNEDDATSGDQDIDTAGTAHDDLSPTKSM